MNEPDDARVREIKNLLDRILPQIASQQQNAGALRLQPPDPRFSGWDSATQPQPAGGSTINPWLFVLVGSLNTIVAAVLAVLITMSLMRPETPREDSTVAARGKMTGASASVMTPAPTPPAAEDQAPPANRPIELAAIGSFDRPLRLEPLKAAWFPLDIQPEDAANREPFIMVLSGLPPRASITGAERIGSDSWLLRPNTSRALEITLAEWNPAVIEVGIELRRTTGMVVARSKAWLSVPPPKMPQAATKLDDDALGDMLQRADQLLGRGDIVAARTLYQRAAELGSGPAALALGGTYDPSRLWSLGVFGMVGNKERARHWYALAEQLGQEAAKERLQNLDP